MEVRIPGDGGHGKRNSHQVMMARGGLGWGGGDQVQRFTPGDHPKGFIVFIRDPNLCVQLVIINNPAFNLV